jgi:hypothetical protein
LAAAEPTTMTWPAGARGGGGHTSAREATPPASSHVDGVPRAEAGGVAVRLGLVGRDDGDGDSASKGPPDDDVAARRAAAARRACVPWVGVRGGGGGGLAAGGGAPGVGIGGAAGWPGAPSPGGASATVPPMAALLKIAR